MKWRTSIIFALLSAATPAAAQSRADASRTDAHARRRAPATQLEQEQSPDEPEETWWDRHHFGTEFGMRVSVIEGPGFDPYANNNLLPQAILGARFTPLWIGPFGLGVVGEYDVGRSEGRARGTPSALTMHRLAGGIEAQVELWRFQLYLRGMPGAVNAIGTLEDAGFERKLETSNWNWVVDAAAGARFQLASARDVVSFWICAEGGYSFSEDMEMTFSPEQDEDDPRHFGSVTLPPLDVSGGTMRLAFALSF